MLPTTFDYTLHADLGFGSVFCLVRLAAFCCCFLRGHALTEKTENTEVCYTHKAQRAVGPEPPGGCVLLQINLR